MVSRPRTENYRLRERDRYLQRTYGISLGEYEELLEKQNHRCAVCERHESEFTTRLAVDHSHKTGEVRGLLCNNCNHRVIGRHTDPFLLRKAYEYLDRIYTGFFVPKKKVKRKKKLNK